MDKQIKGFEGYTIDINGVVKRNGIAVKQYVRNSHGKRYCIVNLSAGEYNSITQVKYVHRLVAECWLNKPESQEYNIIQHKDGNTLNNKAFNLQWIRRKDVKYKGNGRAGKTHTKAAKSAISSKLKGSNNGMNKGAYICEFKRFDSALAAANNLKISVGTVIRRCLNDKNRAKGWYFIEKQRL